MQLALFENLDEIALDKHIITPKSAQYEQFLTDWAECHTFTLDIETGYDRNEFPNPSKKDLKEALKRGLDPIKGKIRLIQIKVINKPMVLVVDLINCYCPRFLGALKSYLDSEKRVVGHNISFDITFILAQFGFVTRHPRCTRVLSTMAWAGIKWQKDYGGKPQPFSHSLSEVANRLLGIKVNKEEQRSNFAEELTNSQINYAANDVIVTEMVYTKLCELLISKESIPSIDGKKPKFTLLQIAQVECDVLPVFAYMTLVGQPVDTKLTKELINDYTNAMTELYKPVMELIGLEHTSQPAKLVSALNKTGINVTSTKSDELLAYKHDITTRLSLTRSLKKQVDTLKAILKSAEAYDGYCKGWYNSLGSTGSGRSTCSSFKKSSFQAINLQNIPNPINHPLVGKFGLLPIKSVITNGIEDGLWLQDLSASHLRFAASNSGDNQLVDILNLKDPHAYVTSLMFKLKGIDKSVDYCVANKGKDEAVSKFRQVAKTALYTQFNGGNAYNFYSSMTKDYIEVDMDTCILAENALKEAFPVYTSYSQGLFWTAQRIGKQLSRGEYVEFRTHDGRIFNTEVRQSTKSDFVYSKTGEITSSMLISPEALVMKKSLIELYEFIKQNPELPIKINSFTHDDISGEDLTEDKVFAKLVYKVISRNFTNALDVASGLDAENLEAYKTVLVSNYSQK